MKARFSGKVQQTTWLLTGLMLVALILLPTFTLAQNTGTISGTVTDQSGAVVPGAKVVLTNALSKETRQSVSNSEGSFSFPSLLPGTYSVKVSASAFKGWEKTGIVLNPGDFRDVPGIMLQVGKQDETITVEAVSGEVAPVDSGEKSSVLTSKQIANLSLEGRDATELIRTLPGFASFNGGGIGNQGQDFTVVSPTGGAVGEGVVAGGSPYRGGTDIISDGAHIIDGGCNCGATTTVNGDFVSEVKVQTSNFGADSAKGPVVVNAVGKAGGTEYHGEAYLHLRDAPLNSLDWAFKHQLLNSPPGLVTAPQSKFLYPGANIGGPIPKTNKKLTFWTGFEYYYQNQLPLAGLTVPGLLTNTVPTVSMRAGNFSTTAADNAQLCPLNPNGTATGNVVGQGFQPMCANLGTNFTYIDPTTGATVNNAPLTYFDPGIAAIMKNVPLPNANPASTGGYNSLIPENINQNGWMWRTRGDYNISESAKLYVTYQVQKETDQVPVHLWWQPGNSIPFPGGMSSKDNSQTLSGHFVKVFNPTLTNDLSGGLGWINYPLVRNSASGWSAAANGYPYQNLFPTKSNMMPDVGNGYWLAGVPQMIQPDIFTNGASFTWKKWNLSFEDAVTKVYKTHTIKGGFYYEKTVNDQGAFSDYNGHLEAVQSGPFACDGANNTPTVQCGSGNPVANFLMGIGNYDQVNKSALDNLWYPTYSGYVQDDWKAMRKLTLNLGLRADHLGAWRSPTSLGVATYTGDLSNDASGIPGFTWHGINSSVPITGRNVPTLTWQPRLGMAYDLRGNGKTVLRGGWGEYGFRDQWNDYAGPADLAQGVFQYNSPHPFTLPYVNSLGASGAVNPAGTGCGLAPLPQCGSLTGLLLTDGQQPLSRNYNFTISQQLPMNSLLEIGYVGSTTLNGPLEGNTNNLDARNLNVIQTGALFGASGCATPLAATSTKPGTGNPCDYGSNGIPTSLFPLSAEFGTNNVQVIRHVGNANYNAFQTSWVRQAGRLTYNLNYTWSKTLGTQGTAQLNGLAPDALSLQHDYGVLSIDRSHVINMSYTFQVGNPVKGNKALQYAANGWNISGITTWQSGPDLQTLAGTANLGLGGNGPQYLASDGTIHTYSISAENYLGTNNSLLEPITTCNPTANLQKNQFFNANCFTLGTPTVAGQNGLWQLPYIHAPAYFNSDLAIFKTFKVTERQSVEFRGSAFNFLNHPLVSFQNNGDSTISYNYQCGAASFANGGPACYIGQGKYVLSNGLAPGTTFNLTGSNSSPGYASTKFGRRVVEFSVKYSF